MKAVPFTDITPWRPTDSLEPPHYTFEDVEMDDHGIITGTAVAHDIAFGRWLTYLAPYAVAEEPPPSGKGAWKHINQTSLVFNRQTKRDAFRLDVSAALNDGSPPKRILVKIAGPGHSYTDESMVFELG